MKEEIKNYIASIVDPIRKDKFQQIYSTINKHLPKGYEQSFAHGMIVYVVPLKLFPAGYHCTPNTPLMLMGLGNGKNYISLHHLGLYGSKPLLDWFTEEYAKKSTAKLDMGKGCVRFKKMEHIPLDVIGALVEKLSVAEWLDIYQSAFDKRK